MKYWEGMYGEQSQDFINGVIAGIEAYAVWGKDGKRYVGQEKRKLKDVIKEVKEQLGWIEKC